MRFPATSTASSIICFTLLLSSTTTRRCCYASSGAAGTETLIGIVGPDYIMLGADSSVSSGSIALTASNLDKIAVVVDPFPEGSGRRKRKTTNNDNKDPSSFHHHQQHQQQQTIAAAAAGDAADADRLLGLLKAQAAIREYEASVGCDVEFVDCSSASASASASAVSSSSSGGDDKDDESSRLTTTTSASATHSVSTPPGLSVEAVAYLARGMIATQLRSATPFRVCLLVAGMMPVSPTTSTRRTTSRLMAPSESEFVSQQVQQQVRQASSSFAVVSEEEEKVSSDDETNKSSKQDDDETVVVSAATRTSTQSQQLLLRPRLYWLDEYGSIQNLKYGAHGYGSNFVLSILDQGYRRDLSRDEAAALLRDCFDQLRTRYVINSPQPPCIKCIDREGCRLIR